MSHVLAFIRLHPDNWLDRLVDEYKISATRDGDLVSLKYNQIESPMHEPIVQECRGMVVRVSTGEILAWPYNKFWNYGEPLAAKVDWNTAQVMEKLDGSLAIVYHDPNHTERDGWRMATSGSPTAGGKFGNSDETFAQAFWRVFDTLGMRVPEPHDRGLTFMFEFCDEPNRIVVKHARPRIVLHGCRDTDVGLGCFGRQCGLESLGLFSRDYNWELVKTYPLTTVDACLSAAEALDPVETEGFVVVDANSNRVKIKSPQYVALHHMKGEFSRRRAIELWVSGETSELIAHFPELADTINEVSAKLDRFAVTAAVHIANANHDILWSSTAPELPSLAAQRKAYAALVKEAPWSSIAFKLFGSHPDYVTRAAVKQTMRNMPISTLEKYLASQEIV